MHFYQRLRDLREDAERSQGDIANLLQISQQHYSMYESGKRELPMHHCTQLLFHALVDNNVGVHCHTQSQYDTCDTGQGEHCTKRSQHTKQEEYTFNAIRPIVISKRINTIFTISMI